MTSRAASNRSPLLQGLARWRLAVPLAAVLLLLSVTQATQRLDWWLFDTFIEQFPLSPPDTLSIVGIDEASLNALGRWPWPRQYHAHLLDQLSRLGAEVVVFDVLFTEPAAVPGADEQLAQAMANQGQVVLPVHIYPLRSQDALTERLPIPRLTGAAAALGHAHVELDSDGIARGLFLREGLGQAVWPNLAVAALELTGTRTFAPANRTSVAPFVKVRENHIRIPLAGLGGAIPTYSYVDILRGDVPAGAFAGQTVFVGATAAGLGDVLPTSLSGNAYPFSGVEFHANIYSALLQHAEIHTVSPWVTAGFGLLLVLVVTGVFPRLQPRGAALGAALLATVPLGASLFLFVQGHLWLEPMVPALVCLLAYPVWSGQRLAVLNQFLNRQLEALSREPRLSLHAGAASTPSRLADQIGELFQPRQVWLYRGNQRLRGKRTSGLPPLTDAGQWEHRTDTSRIVLRYGGEYFELGLEWNDEQDRTALSEYLDKLPLQARDQTVADKHSRDRLTRRIQQARAAAQTMADLRSFIRQGFERMPDGVIVTDSLGVILIANGHVADWFAQPAASLPGMPLARLLDSSDSDHQTRWRAIIEAALIEQRYSTESLRLQEADLLLHLAPFPGATGEHPGLIINVADISDVREQQRQYREAIDFISHDVRSPLVSQLALIQQLKRQDDPASQDQLDHVARLAQRSYQLAEEFVQLARAEQLAAIQFYEAEVLAIAENAVDAVQDQASSKRIVLTIRGEEDLWMRGNAELAERAVINLLTNAISYSPAGSSIQVHVIQDGSYSVIAIQDQGRGIPAEELPRLFERFQRSRHEEQSGNRGAGLGLAFVKVVAERHGGKVEVTSRAGEGSTFRLCLPLVTEA